MGEGGVRNLLVGCCIGLLAVTIVAAHIAGARPRTRREWVYVTVTLTFVIWLLAGFIFLRSQ